MKNLLIQLEWSEIIRFLADECSDEETKAIDRWIKAAPSRKEEMEHLKKIWNVSNSLKIDSDQPCREIEYEWNCLARKMHSLDDSVNTQNSVIFKQIPLSEVTRELKCLFGNACEVQVNLLNK